MKHLADICRSRGVQVPADPVDFLNRARVHFLDAQGRPVPIESATIIWEEG